MITGIIRAFGFGHVFNWIDQNDITSFVLSSGDSDAWGGYTFRQGIRADKIDESGDYVRFSFRGGNSQGITIDKCYAGVRHATNLNDFAAAPTQVTFNDGSPSIFIPANTTKMCDPIQLTLQAGVDSLLISGFVHNNPSNDAFRYRNVDGLGEGVRMWYKLGDTAASTTVTGYTEGIPTHLILDDLDTSI